MNKISLMILLVLSLCFLPKISSSTELYFLDSSQILLYKIINWWYFAPDEDSGQLCGDTIKCVNIEHAKVSSIDNGSTIKISIDGGFAPLLSVVKECETCSGSFSTQARWLNEKYFANSNATLTIKETSFNNEYSILVSRNEKDKLQGMKENADHLVFTLIGTVQGLQDGKVTMNPKGDLIGKCHGTGNKNMPSPTVHLVVSSSENDTILMKFDLTGRRRN